MIYRNCFICDKEYPIEIKTIRWIPEKKQWFCDDCADVDKELKIVEKNGSIYKGRQNKNNK